MGVICADLGMLNVRASWEHMSKQWLGACCWCMCILFALVVLHHCAQAYEQGNCLHWQVLLVAGSAADAAACRLTLLMCCKQLQLQV
jgi:hypothetical protein